MRLADYEQTLDRTAETLPEDQCLLATLVSGLFHRTLAARRRHQYSEARRFRPAPRAHNGTVVVDAHEGEVNNRHKAVTDRHGVPVVHLSDDDTEWTIYEPKGPMAVLNEIYPNGIKIPKILVGKNISIYPR